MNICVIWYNSSVAVVVGRYSDRKKEKGAFEASEGITIIIIIMDFNHSFYNNRRQMKRTSTFEAFLIMEKMSCNNET